MRRADRHCQLERGNESCFGGGILGPVIRQPAEKLLIPVEVRRNEIAEFDRTGREVSIVDPSYS
jgi:hypothetical protein